MLAQEEARLLNHSFIGTEHLLLALIDEGDGVAAKALEQLGVELEVVRDRVAATVGVTGTAPTGSPPFTPRAKRVLELSLREALQLGHNYIGTEHMLLGLVREGEGVGAQVLVSLGLDLSKVREQVVRSLAKYGGAGETTTPQGESEMLRAGRNSSVERVGKEWSARVVRPGRTPADYEAAYEDLEGLFEGLGVSVIDLDLSGLVVTSVETEEGPGLCLSINHRIHDADPNATS